MTKEIELSEVAHEIERRDREIIAAVTEATIERCARAAEWFYNVEKFTAEDVATRIRALKDKP